MLQFYEEKKDQFEWGFPLIEDGKEIHSDKFKAYVDKNWGL